MQTSYFLNFSNLSQSTKNKIIAYVIYSFAWFLADLFFVLAFQFYLVELGIVQGSMGGLPRFVTSSNFLLIAVILIGSLRSIFVSMRAYYSSMLYQQFIKDNRQTVLELSLKNHQNKRTFETNALFNEVIFQAGNFWQQFAILVSNLLILAVLSFGALFNYKLDFIACSLLVVGSYGFFHIILKKLSFKNDEIVSASYRLSRFLIESMRNSMFFNVYRMVDTLLLESKKNLESYFEIYKKFSFLSSIKSALPQIIGLVVVLFYSNYMYEHHNITAAQFIAFFYVFIRLANQASEFVSSAHLCKMNYDGSIKLKNWIQEISQMDSSKQSNMKKVDDSFHEPISLEIENLKYSYTIEKRVINNLFLSLKQGDILQLHGSSGSGKSTLLSLILGLNNNFEGSIKYRGISVSDLGINFANELAYVGPDSFFIEATLRENLLLGNPRKDTMTDDEIVSALRFCSIFEEIFAKSEGLDLLLNEQVQFSTGQKQRISLARAILRKPKLLILDEATANIDEANERKIIKIIKDYSPSAITIVVSHKGEISGISNVSLKMGQNENA